MDFLGLPDTEPLTILCVREDFALYGLSPPSAGLFCLSRYSLKGIGGSVLLVESNLNLNKHAVLCILEGIGKQFVEFAHVHVTFI